MKKISTGLVLVMAVFVFTVPSVSRASTFSSAQISSVIALLQAFAVDTATIARVSQALGAAAVAAAPSLPVTPPVSTHVPTTGTPYLSSNLGYDLSFNTTVYPSEFFHFGVIGVTAGKALVDNKRLASEIAWSHVSSAGIPTVYMNLNAPYGSTVAGNIGGPKTCAPRPAGSSEPTACEGYNYGYNAAAHSYAYTQSNGLTPVLWWLDIEDANSWSADVSVNDATIQGAIDYLNSRGARVGLYSVPYMWKAIAGTSFIPTQTINGSSVTIPSWVPIGTATQVQAINACLTRPGIIPGSPVWLLQYEASSTAVDQNIAC